MESVTWIEIEGRRSIDDGDRQRHFYSPRRRHTAPLLASPRPQSKVTSHALTARGSNDNGLVLIKFWRESRLNFEGEMKIGI
jgi:hypothetical protein